MNRSNGTDPGLTFRARGSARWTGGRSRARKAFAAVGRRVAAFGLVAAFLLGAALSTPLAGAETDPTAAEIKIDPRLGAPFALRERPKLGSDTAAIVVVEVAGFKCSHCRWFHEQVFPRLREQYIATGKVQWIMIPAAPDPAERYHPAYSAAHCADRQGKYWDVLGDFFRIGGRASSLALELIGKIEVLDQPELQACLRDRALPPLIAADFSEATRLKIRGTPTFFVRKLGADGRRTEARAEGAQTLEYFQRLFDQLLQEP